MGSGTSGGSGRLEDVSAACAACSLPVALVSIPVAALAASPAEDDPGVLGVGFLRERSLPVEP